MHEAALAKAALPPPVVCLGMALRPFSLGHFLWLLREEVLSDTGILKEDALLTAVFICCQSWRENLNTKRDWLMSAKIWLWQKRLRRARRWRYADEMARFRQYIEDGLLQFRVSDQPRNDEYSRPTRLPGAPYVLQLQQWLMLKLGLPEHQAWDYPFGYAKMRWQAYWEQEGGLDLYNEHESKFDRFIEEQEAQAGLAPMTTNPS